GLGDRRALPVTCLRVRLWTAALRLTRLAGELGVPRRGCLLVIETLHGTALHPSIQYALYGPHHVCILRRDEGEGVACLSGAARAPYAMGVRICCIWHVVVDDVRNACHFNAASSNI